MKQQSTAREHEQEWAADAGCRASMTESEQHIFLVICFSEKV